MKDDLFTELLKVYDSIQPHERQWTRFKMSNATLEELKHRTDWREPPPPLCLSTETREECLKRNGMLMNSQLFGIPIDIDDSIPFLHVAPDTETPQERRIKEFAAEMLRRKLPVTIQTIHMDPWPRPLNTAPTLKGLLKHWAKKWRKNG